MTSQIKIKQSDYIKVRVKPTDATKKAALDRVLFLSQKVVTLVTPNTHTNSTVNSSQIEGKSKSLKRIAQNIQHDLNKKELNKDKLKGYAKELLTNGLTVEESEDFLTNLIILGKHRSWGWGSTSSITKFTDFLDSKLTKTIAKDKAFSIAQKIVKYTGEKVNNVSEAIRRNSSLNIIIDKVQNGLNNNDFDETEILKQIKTGFDLSEHEAQDLLNCLKTMGNHRDFYGMGSTSSITEFTRLISSLIEDIAIDKVLSINEKLNEVSNSNNLINTLVKNIREELEDGLHEKSSLNSYIQHVHQNHGHYINNLFLYQGGVEDCQDLLNSLVIIMVKHKDVHGLQGIQAYNNLKTASSQNITTTKDLNKIINFSNNAAICSAVAKACNDKASNDEKIIDSSGQPKNSNNYHTYAVRYHAKAAKLYYEAAKKCNPRSTTLKLDLYMHASKEIESKNKVLKHLYKNVFKNQTEQFQNYINKIQEFEEVKALEDIHKLKEKINLLNYDIFKNKVIKSYDFATMLKLNEINNFMNTYLADFKAEKIIALIGPQGELISETFPALKIPVMSVKEIDLACDIIHYIELNKNNFSREDLKSRFKGALYDIYRSGCDNEQPVTDKLDYLSEGELELLNLGSTTDVDINDMFANYGYNGEKFLRMHPLLRFLLSSYNPVEFYINNDVSEDDIERSINNTRLYAKDIFSNYKFYMQNKLDIDKVLNIVAKQNNYNFYINDGRGTGRNNLLGG